MDEEEDMTRRTTWWAFVVLAAASMLLWGCGASDEPGGVTPEAGSGSADFPVKDPSEPFAVDEQGTVTLTNDQAYTIVVRRASGGPLYQLSFKKNGVIDPRVDFTVQTVPFEMPEELAGQYVAVGERALELHAADEPGYGFALRPELQVYYTEEEIAQAAGAGAALDPVHGNVLVLYKEQRSPKWVPQTSVGVDEADQVVAVSNIAGSGAWMLVAKAAR
jgi:hypothetical protein